MFPKKLSQGRLSAHLFLFFVFFLCTSVFLQLSCSQGRAVNFGCFDSAFEFAGQIEIAGINSANATAFAVDPNGMIFVIDSQRKAILKFGPDGGLLATFGSSGTEPGQFSLPWALACDRQGRVYVLDLNISRVSIFSGDGEFLRSFLFAGQGFSGLTIAVGSSGDIYIGGRQQAREEHKRHLIHRFTAEGAHISSFFLIDPAVDRLNLRLVGGVQFVLDEEDRLFAIQPIDPMFYRISSGGKVLRGYGHQPTFYRPPFRFPDPLPKRVSDVQELLDRWTQMNNIFLLRKELVMLVYSVHSPVEYAIELYDRDGTLKSGPIGSDLLPLFTDVNDVIYFQAKERDREANINKITLLKYSLIREKEPIS